VIVKTPTSACLLSSGLDRHLWLVRVRPGLFFYFFYCLLIFYVIFQTPLEKKLTLAGWQNLILGAFIFIYYLFLLLVNLLFWTPYKSKVADGIQGRYFIFIFPFLLFLLINLRKKYLPKSPPVGCPRYDTPHFFIFFFSHWLTILLETIIIALFFEVFW
jgi:hypothetical protein